METIEQKLRDFLGVKLRTHEPMSLHTTLKTGGSSRYYVEIDRLDELIRLLRIIHEIDLPFEIIGGGSHVVVSDRGFDGIIIKNNCRKFELMSMVGKIRSKELNVDKAFLYAESGALTNQVVRYSLENGFSGLEYMLGLPGTIGGAIVTNADFPPKNFSIQESVHRVRILTADGEIKDIDKDFFRFRKQYQSLFKKGAVILSVIFLLTPGIQKILWDYGHEAALYRNSTSGFLQTGVTYRSIAFSQSDSVIHTSLPSIDRLLNHSGIANEEHSGITLYPENPRFLLNRNYGKTTDGILLLEKIKKIMKQKYNVFVDIQIDQIGV